MLCQTCTRVLGDCNYYVFDRIHYFSDVLINLHQTYRDFLNSVNENCRLCTVLGERPLLASPVDGYLTELRLRYLEQEDTSQPTAFELGIRIKCGYLDKWFSFPLHHQSFAPKSRASALSTASEQSWAQATDWLNDCLMNHSGKCTTQTPDGWTPTRLLDVGTETNPLLCLVQGSQLSSDLTYVTLSHCWGGKMFLQLTKNTLSRLSEGFRMKDLPLTFQHAVEVARRLQVRYLWIDSLCIIQDDEYDWVRESQTMHKVYSYSFCNIAAMAATDASQGLFAGELFEQVTICMPLNFLDRGNTPVQYTVEFTNRHYHDIETSPLNLRAWFQQERYIARRTLFFSKSQLYWQCRDIFTSEEWPLGIPHDPELSDEVSSGPYKHIVTAFDIKPDRPETASSTYEELRNGYDCWRTITEQYSRCALTFPSDKLVALSGLAQCIGSVTKDTYVAGMWQQALIWDMLWFSLGKDGDETHRPAKYRAPTFSWASIDGPTKMNRVQYEGTEELAKVISLDMKLSKGPYGPVSGGTIRLSGQLWRLYIEPSEGEDNGNRTQAFNNWAYSERGRRIMPLDAPLEDAVGEAYNQDLLFCVSVTVCISPDNLANVTQCHYEFLLLKCIDRHVGRYCRVGLLREVLKYDIMLEVAEGWQHHFPRLIWDEDPDMIPSVSYDPGTGRHIIGIE